MIIGKNTKFNQNNIFQEKFNSIQEEGKKIIQNQPKYNSNVYADVTNKKEMTEKSFNMLQERLSKGLISLEEFNKQCQKLNRFRNK